MWTKEWKEPTGDGKSAKEWARKGNGTGKRDEKRRKKWKEGIRVNEGIEP